MIENILISFVLPILTAIISYMAAVNKSKKELETVKEQHKTELEKIERQSRADIEKLEKDMEAQSKLYESAAQTDVMKGMMERVMNNPSLNKAMGEYMAKEFKKQFGD